MSFPDSLTTRTVKGRFVTFPQGVAGPATGYVLISLQNTMQGPDDNAFVLPFERRIDFDQNGEIEVVLPATNDPQWSPSFYRISIHTQMGTKRSYDGCLEPIYRVKTYRLEIPYDSTAELELTDVLNVGLPQPGQLYVVRTMLGAANGVATLGSDGKVPSSQLPSSAGGNVDWADVENKPATFPSDPVSWTDVEDKPTTFPHDTVSWSEVQGKPTTFPASSVEWTSVQNKPATYPTAPVLWTDVQNKPTTFPASSVDWTGVQNKPATYPHDAISWDEIEDKPDLSGGGTITWDAVSGKPSTFPPSTHSHIQSEVTGLTTALGGKSDVGHTHTQSDVSGLTSALTAKADASAVATSLSTKANSSDVTTALAAKADTTYVDNHLADKADTTELTSGLATKAEAADVATALATRAPLASPTFTGTVSGITAAMVGLGNVTNTSDANKPVSTAQQTALNLKADASSVTSSLAAKADLVAGTIPTSQIPAIAITEFLGSVANQTAMLALVGQKGDWCIRTDLAQHWIITGSDSSQLASWTAIPLAAVPVQTVNGQTGTVVLGKADVGLGNVDNTSDANKPVSTAQTTALALKAPLASPTFTGTVSGVTAAMVGLGNVDNTADASKPVSTAQQTALNLKAPLASPAFTGTVTGITASMVGLANVNNTTDANKPVSTAQQAALDLKAPLASPTFTGTVAGITAAMVGLSNVTNTSDANKPVSTAQQAALDAKAPLASPAFTGTVTGVSKTMVGLGNADNTSDASKPVSTAQQSALDAKAPLASPTFTGTVSGISKAMIGLANVDNTADTSKPISTAQQSALDAKAPLASPTFTGTVSGITKTMVGLGSVDNTSDTGKPISTAQQAALDLKAPLSSPSLTGTPTAPTATTGTNTTQLATTAFVTTAVAAGGGSSSWTGLTNKPDFLTDHTVSLRRWYAALANRHYSPAKIAVVGDSISEGIGATQYGRAWVPMTLNHLRDKFPVSGIPGGPGFVAAWDNPGMNFDVPAYTYPVAWSGGGTVTYVGWSMKSGTISASGVTATYDFVGTSIHIWYVKQSGGGTFSVTIDGTVVAATVTTTVASGWAVGIWTSSALTQGPHRIVITTTSASPIFINGFRVFDGDESAGIQMFNGGQSGLKTQDFSDGTPTDGYSWASFLSTIAPQLVILELGLNDWSTNVAIATVKANLKTIISTIRSGSATNPAIVLYASPWVNDGAYAYPFTTLRQCWLEVVAEDTGGYGGASGVALFDAAARFLSPQVDTSDGYYYNNGIHPSDKGHSAIADALTSFLSPV